MSCGRLARRVRRTGGPAGGRGPRRESRPRCRPTGRARGYHVRGYHVIVPAQPAPSRPAREHDPGSVDTTIGLDITRPGTTIGLDTTVSLGEGLFAVEP